MQCPVEENTSAADKALEISTESQVAEQTKLDMCSEEKLYAAYSEPEKLILILGKSLEEAQTILGKPLNIDLLKADKDAKKDQYGTFLYNEGTVPYSEDIDISLIGNISSGDLYVHAITMNMYTEFDASSMGVKLYPGITWDDVYAQDFSESWFHKFLRPDANALYGDIIARIGYDFEPTPERSTIVISSQYVLYRYFDIPQVGLEYILLTECAEPETQPTEVVVDAHETLAYLLEQGVRPTSALAMYGYLEDEQERYSQEYELQRYIDKMLEAAAAQVSAQEGQKAYYRFGNDLVCYQRTGSEMVVVSKYTYDPMKGTLTQYRVNANAKSGSIASLQQIAFPFRFDAANHSYSAVKNPDAVVANPTQMWKQMHDNFINYIFS